MHVSSKSNLLFLVNGNNNHRQVSRTGTVNSSFNFYNIPKGGRGSLVA